MAQRFYRILPRLVAVVILVNLALLMGCGGTAGVENGRIVGKVFSNLRNASAQRLAEPGVTVVAQREGGTPLLVRTTVTATDGTYTFPDLPTGAYVIGFAKEGFRTIDTQAGATSTRTAVGSQVRVFIESGRTSVAPDVTMVALQPTGDATIIVTVKDRVSGVPITNAIVTANAVTQTKNVNGVYTLVVPFVRANDSDAFGSKDLSAVISARAEGFENFPIANDVSTVRALPGETTTFTAIMTPLGPPDAGAVTLQGTYRFANFQNQLALTTNIRLGVRNVSDGLISAIEGRLNPANGTWVISGLPPSTSTIQRTFDLAFEHPDIVTNVLSGQTMPKGGTVTITNPVVLQPLLVDVIGRVTVSADSGATVNDPVDDANFSVARIVETGQSATLSGGTFQIKNVPSRNINGETGWKLRITAKSKTTGNIFKANDVTINPLNTTNSNDPVPVFDVGLITANTVAN